VIALHELARWPAIVVGLGVVKRAFVGADVGACDFVELVLRSGRHAVVFPRPEITLSGQGESRAAETSRCSLLYLG
jgi:hypothetical protein